MNKILATAFAVFAATSVGMARAQNFPDRPIKAVSAYPAGGPSDTMARLGTQGLGAELGQSVIVENIPGAGGRIGTRAVPRAAPDGYTLLLGGTNDNAVTPALYKNLDYDPVNDFAPVAAVATDSQALVVNPSVPVHTLAELVRYAKDHPGKLSSAFRESGFEGFPELLWFGLFAPVGTPPDVIAKLSTAVNARLKLADTQAAVAKLGLETNALSAQGFGAVMDEQVRLWDTVAREAGVRLD